MRTAALLVSLLGSSVSAQEKIEIVRDTWGVPHVFATTDEGAMFGLGRACAEDRPFQMYHYLRIMQGRLAELIGNVRDRRGRGNAVQRDRKMRTFGWWRHAQRVAKNLDPETQRLLAAYCQGVNAWLDENRGKLPEPFGRLGLDPEPWTPAACLVSWWHVAQFFATDGTRDLIAWRNARNPQRRQFQPPRVPPDDDVAIIQRSNVSDEWVEKVEAFVEQQGLRRSRKTGEPKKKFSHAWVVGGRKTTTGAAVLVSDPQTPVTNPALFLEFHARGETFDARGIGVAGSPTILIGFNRQVAWGLTARGADQADLFCLTTSPDRPDEYELDGEWKKMQVRREKIRVRGGRAQELVVRETVFGPVVSAFAFRQPREPEVALRRVPFTDHDIDTVQSGFAMMRAKNVREFARALHGWRFPTANCLYGDKAGAIGYMTIGAIPVRSRASGSLGREAHDGSSKRFDWQAWVPGDLMPQLIDPDRGFILSGNHRPIASFYEIPIGASTGVGGESLRSWRVRELLNAKKRFTPEDVLKVHHDTTNAAKRELVRIGIHLQHGLGIDLEPPARLATEHLRPWLERGAPTDLRTEGAALASLLDLNFRFVATPLARTWGGGQSGLARFLKATAARIAKDSGATLDPEEWDLAEQRLGAAWRQASARWGRDPSAWKERAARDVTRARLGWHSGLDGFPTLDPKMDVPMPPLYCVDGNTILSQRAQSYTQWVPLHDVDQALTILPPGQSEHGPHRLSTKDLWQEGRLHPAPLSREAVLKVGASRTVVGR